MPDNRKGFASALHIRGLRQRWMFSAVLPILLLLVLAVALFSVGVQEYYYNAMRSGLESRARIAAETFSGYGVKSYSEYYRLASYSAETFEEKDTIELQFINTNGRVQVSSYGLTAGTLPGTSDIDAAVGGEMAFYQGRDPQTGENILAVSYPLYFNSRVVGVLRYVTSLREAQHRVLMDSLLASAAALVCMVLIAASNAIFINNVVEPVAVVSDAARRISGGSYGIMIENRYRDELGELVDNINDMSMKISQSEKIQQEFISSVSHELRTPLTGIRGMVEPLMDGVLETEEEKNDCYQVIYRETRRLEKLIGEMLDLSRLQDGRAQMELEAICVEPVLERAVESVARLAENAGIELTVDADEGAVCMGNEERIIQVLIILLDNALSFTPTGGHIAVRAKKDGRFVELSVHDDGAGIEPKDLPYIWERFYKADKSRMRTKGTGLGLAIAKKVVELMGGTIGVQSEVGKGSAFTLRLPSADAPADN